MTATEQIWIIQSNDGRRVWTTAVRAEAAFYAWLGVAFCEYNVYRQGGNGTPLIPQDV